VAAGYFFCDILREISAMRRGRRSARTLSTMLSTVRGRGPEKGAIAGQQQHYGKQKQ
jgi:hypothetical protein